MSQAAVIHREEAIVDNILHMLSTTILALAESLVVRIGLRHWGYWHGHVYVNNTFSFRTSSTPHTQYTEIHAGKTPTDGKQTLDYCSAI